MDIVFPKDITTRRLTYLAAEAGFTSPWKHRAIFDVMTMLKLASAYDLDAIVARAREPLLYVQAVVSFDEKEKAKELGFRWFAPGKQWWKPMKVSDLEAMKPTCGFQTRLLAGPLE
jgi:DNA polymerase-3 subunit epsilon